MFNLAEWKTWLEIVAVQRGLLSNNFKTQILQDILMLSTLGASRKIQRNRRRKNGIFTAMVNLSLKRSHLRYLSDKCITMNFPHIFSVYFSYDKTSRAHPILDDSLIPGALWLKAKEPCGGCGARGRGLEIALQHVSNNTIQIAIYDIFKTCKYSHI